MARDTGGRTFGYLAYVNGRPAGWVNASSELHDLRHEAGSRKLEAGRPLHAVSGWLGHTKLGTTAKCLNVKLVRT
jgi:integrase